MNSILTILVGIPLGIASSILAWWFVAHAIRPKLSWHDPSFVKVPGSAMEWDEVLIVKLRNDSKRDAIDITIHGELRVDHKKTEDGITKTLLRFPLNSNWMPMISNEAKIRIEHQKIPVSEWERLRGRTGIVERDIKIILSNSENISVRFYALAYDRYSGAKKIFVKEYSFQDIG